MGTYFQVWLIEDFAFLIQSVVGRQNHYLKLYVEAYTQPTHQTNPKGSGPSYTSLIFGHNPILGQSHYEDSYHSPLHSLTTYHTNDSPSTTKTQLPHYSHT